uniref:Retro-transcribing virus envelope glycoprotein domain-containing protein n=1 Tax=Macaca mulatta TaxID=9544 RepID=A0A5F7ZRB2_MACMU
MLAVVNCQVTAGEFIYWAYIPFPPLYQGVAWGDREVPVFTNDTAWMPSPFLNQDPELDTGTVNSSYQFGVEGLPICLGGSPHCLHLSHDAWAVSYNHSHISALSMIIVAQSFKYNHTAVLNETLPSTLSLCPIPNVSGGVSQLEWTRCRGSGPRLLLEVKGKSCKCLVTDWSVHGDFQTKFSHVNLHWHKGNHSISADGNETIIWHDGGLSPPMPHLANASQIQGHIWKLLAASKPMFTFTGNMSLNLTNIANPFHITLHRNSSRYVIACVRKPYLLLTGVFKWDNNTGVVNCINNCTFLSCINATWWNNNWNESHSDLYILRARKETWLTVNLTRTWSESAEVTQIYKVMQDLVHHSRRMVGIVVTAVIGLVAISSTAAVAGLALHQSIQNAEFVQQWHEQSHLLWQQQ